MTWKKAKPARQVRGVRVAVQLQIEFALHERTQLMALGAGSGGRVGERLEHWIMDVEPRDAARTLRAFRKIVSAIETERGPGGRLHQKPKARKGSRS